MSTQNNPNVPGSPAQAREQTSIGQKFALIALVLIPIICVAGFFLTRNLPQLSSEQEAPVPAVDVPLGKTVAETKKFLVAHAPDANVEFFNGEYDAQLAPAPQRVQETDLVFAECGRAGTLSFVTLASDVYKQFDTDRFGIRCDNTGAHVESK